jgi:hypothetical protein
MQSLEATLEKVTNRSKHPEKVRRYIVAEAIYQVCLISFFVEVLIVTMHVSRSLLALQDSKLL